MLARSQNNMSHNGYNRRDNGRIKMNLPALLSRQMVKTINISLTGARLVVRGSQLSTPRMPLLIKNQNEEFTGLICEPQWEQKIGDNLYILGVSFPQGQEDLVLLRQQLAS